MKNRKSILNVDSTKLKAYVESLGQPSFRAKQISDWLYKKNTPDFDGMKNLPVELREKLKETYFISPCRLDDEILSRDGARKFIFELPDGVKIESVLIPEDDRATLCVSSQAGCAMGCKFCCTGKRGFTRNLETSEILGQVLEAKRIAGSDSDITNLVFMGMGEPFENFSNLVKALETITSPDGMNIPGRRITVSTVGLTKKIAEFGKLGLARLAISLNAADDVTRKSIMPADKRNPISAIMDACRDYPLKARERITFEYVLLNGVNDREEDAWKLCGLLSGIPCKINLIRFNEYPGAEFTSPGMERVELFRSILIKRGLDVFLRSSRGQDISAACGRLGGSTSEKQ